MVEKQAVGMKWKRSENWNSWNISERFCSFVSGELEEAGCMSSAKKEATRVETACSIAHLRQREGKRERFV